MPQFTQWNVPSPFPNVLYNPMAVDKAIAEMGHLDVERQRLDLDRDKIARDQAAGAAWLKSGETPTTAPTTDGTAPAGGGGGGSFLSALADIESGDKNIVSGVDKDNRGLTVAQGGNPAEISQGHFQIHTGTWRDFAPQAGVDISKYPNAMSAPREIQAQVASVIPFKRFGPRTQTMMRERFGDFDSNQTVGTLAGLGPRVAPAAPGARVAAPPQVAMPAAPPPFNPAAGPRVGMAPPTTAPAIVPPPRPTAEIPPPVRAAAQALLAMPEAEAAVAYKPIIQELQAQGLAQNAPPEYPGHEATLALVGGEPAAPDVAPSRQAMRLGGTAAAGPGAGQATLPPIEQPNQLYQTGIPGITLRLPGSGPLAPPPVVTAAAPPSPGAASGGGATRPPVLTPQPAPSRVIQRDPLMQSGPGKGLTRAQFDAAGGMLSGGMPFAQVMTHVEQWRQQNTAARQQDAQQAAIEQQQNWERDKEHRRQQVEAEKTDYDRKRQAAKDAAEAAEAAKLQQSKGEDADTLRVLQAIAPKIRNGVTLTPEEADQYDLHRRRWADGPIANVPDGKGGTIQAHVGREISDRFPPLPGQKEYAGLRPIPGTEKQPDPAPANVVTAMLDIGAGNRKIVKALDQLNAYPAGVGIVPGSQGVTMSNWTDPEGVKVRRAIGVVQGHIYHELAGTAQSTGETARLRTFVPGEKDDAAAVRIKLQAMLDDNRETLLDHYRTFGPETSYRRQRNIEEEILSTIPETAVEHLKQNPKTAKEFDKMFGRGAAKLALQND